MFLLIPLIIFAASVGSLVYITRKKSAVLKQFSSQTNIQIGETGGFSAFIHEMLPEIFGVFEKEKVAGHQSYILVELEKNLRKTRMFFLRLDALFFRWIHSIREKHADVQQVIKEKAEEKPVSYTQSYEVPTPELVSVSIPATLPSEPIIAEPVKPVEPQPEPTSNPIPTAEPVAEIVLPQEQVLIQRIASDPKNAMLYKQLGDLYMNLQQFNDAKHAFELAMQLNPGIRGVKVKLASIKKQLRS